MFSDSDELKMKVYQLKCEIFKWIMHRPSELSARQGLLTAMACFGEKVRASRKRNLGYFTSRCTEKFVGSNCPCLGELFVKSFDYV